MAATYDETGAHFTWTLLDPAVELQDWPTVELDGYELPGQLITVVISQPGPVALRIDAVETEPWTGDLATATGDLAPDSAHATQPTPPASPALPTVPAFVLSEATAQGTRLAVIAFSPLHGADGDVQVATKIVATVVGAAAYNPWLPPAQTQTGRNGIEVAQSPLRPDAQPSPLESAFQPGDLDGTDPERTQGTIRVWVGLALMLLLIFSLVGVLIGSRR